MTALHVGCRSSGIWLLRVPAAPARPAFRPLCFTVSDLGVVEEHYVEQPAQPGRPACWRWQKPTTTPSGDAR